MGKGLDALIKNNPGASEEVLISTGLGLHNVQVAKSGRPANVPACIEVDAEGGLWCDVNFLKPNPKQPRQDFKQKELEELCESIKQVGILEPIIVEPVEGKENTFYIFLARHLHSYTCVWQILPTNMNCHSDDYNKNNIKKRL